MVLYDQAQLRHKMDKSCVQSKHPDLFYCIREAMKGSLDWKHHQRALYQLAVIFYSFIVFLVDFYSCRQRSVNE